MKVTDHLLGLYIKFDLQTKSKENKDGYFNKIIPKKKERSTLDFFKFYNTKLDTNIVD